MDKPVVTISVLPKQCLFDQPLRIIAENLQPRKSYTIVAQCKIDKVSKGFQSYAFYIADDKGKIDLNFTKSYGGSFTGIEPMGLIWSMESLNESEYMRNISKFRLQNPATSYDVVFSIFERQENPSVQTNNVNLALQQRPLAQATITRLIHSASVERIQVREGRLRGALYVPAGSGPFQGVLDITGVPRRHLLDQRARLLASHGYVAFAAGCVDYDGSPDKDHLELEYFLECAEWLSSLPNVAKTGIAITATCYGGTIALYLALLSTIRVKGVVVINACSYFFDYSIYYRGKLLPKHADLSKLEISKDNLYENYLHVYPVLENLAVPIEQAAKDTNFLIIAGEDDHIINPEHSRHLARRLERAGTNKFKLLTYPYVGHIFAQPYNTFVSNVPSAPVAERFPTQRYSGGDMVAHAKAQDESWKETLKLLAELSLHSKV